MSRILITGARGNVGRFAAQYAIEGGADVTIAGTNPDALRRMYSDRAKAVRFDFTDSSTYEEALRDVDRVFIMRPPQLGNPQDIKLFIQALKEKGDIRLVCFLSLLGVEHNPFPPHGKIEKAIKEAGLPYCFLRPSFFMQNLSGVHALEIREFDRIVVPVKQAVTSFIDAENIGEMAAKVLREPERHANTAYSITGLEALNYDQVAEILTHVLGRTITYANPSIDFASQYWVNIRGLEKDYVSVMSMLYLLTRLGSAKQVTDVYEQVMGKKPATFAEFAEKNKAVWMK